MLEHRIAYCRVERVVFQRDVVGRGKDVNVGAIVTRQLVVDTHVLAGMSGDEVSIRLRPATDVHQPTFHVKGNDPRHLAIADVVYKDVLKLLRHAALLTGAGSS